jgi:hypothetical protein
MIHRLPIMIGHDITSVVEIGIMRLKSVIVIVVVDKAVNVVKVRHATLTLHVM